MSKPVLGPVLPPIQRALGALSLGAKQLSMKLTTDLHQVLRSKNAWSYTSTLPYIFMVWCLVKHRDNFTFTIYSEQKQPVCLTKIFCSYHESVNLIFF
jgi:hypothetical protein